MNVAAGLYRTTERWMYKAYDQYLFGSNFRSVLAWGLALLVGLTMLGGVLKLRELWGVLGDHGRFYLILGLAWLALPWLRAVRIQRLSRSSARQAESLSDRETRASRETVTTLIVSVVSVCGAANALLEVIAELAR